MTASIYQLFDLLHDQHFVEIMRINFSSSMHNVLPTLQKYFFDDGNLDAFSTFRLIQGVPFVKLLTKWGLCMNFNLQPMESLLHTNRKIFHQAYND